MIIDPHQWHPGLTFLFLLTPFVISLSGVAIGVYIASSRHFDDMLAALPNSPWPRYQQSVLGTTSLSTRCYLVSTISGALFFASFNIRKGVLDADDVSGFPRRLRRLMDVSIWLLFVGMSWLCLAVGLLELTEG